MGGCGETASASCLSRLFLLVPLHHGLLSPATALCMYILYIHASRDMLSAGRMCEMFKCAIGSCHVWRSRKTVYSCCCMACSVLQVCDRHPGQPGSVSCTMWSITLLECDTQWHIPKVTTSDWLAAISEQAPAGFVCPACIMFELLICQLVMCGT